MFLAEGQEVRDLRLYITKQYQGQGYGHAIVCFVKAFFFPYFTKLKSGAGRSKLRLPLGGSCGAKTISVLPVTVQSKAFYRKHGFRTVVAKSKWFFCPGEVAELVRRRPSNTLFAAANDHDHEVDDVDDEGRK